MPSAKCEVDRFPVDPEHEEQQASTSLNLNLILHNINYAKL